jgi:hypothetical protein
MGNPKLRAIEDVAVPVEHGSGLKRGRVTSRLRLAQGKAPKELSGGQARQPSLPLRLRPVLRQNDLR